MLMKTETTSRAPIPVCIALPLLGSLRAGSLKGGDQAERATLPYDSPTEADWFLSPRPSEHVLSRNISKSSALSFLILKVHGTA